MLLPLPHPVTHVFYSIDVILSLPQVVSDGVGRGESLFFDQVEVSLLTTLHNPIYKLSPGFTFSPT